MTEERKAFEKQLYPLYNFYHKHKDAIQLKDANFKYQKKIQIFKGEDFIKFTTTYFEDIKNLLPDKKKDAISIAKYLNENRIIVKIDRLPDDPKKKWPRKVSDTKDQTFTNEGFYTWNLVVKSKMNNLIMAGILLAVFVAFLYPIWPFAFKFGVFKVTLYLLVFLVALQVIRLIVYIISRLLGYAFWILPNLNNDSYGILGSFKPLYSNYKYTDGKLEISLRLIGIIAFIFLIYVIVQEPSYITGFQDASSQTIDDILDWGKDKLEGKQEPLHRRAIPDLSELMKQAEEDLANHQKTNTQEGLDQQKHSDDNHNVDQDDLNNNQDLRDMNNNNPLDNDVQQNESQTDL
ncbi:unnamed protein product [Paramecium octaurelia]|uniref:Translocation protein SEC62 n=1 Tax=Paramecium octaurelia TaxID=43137 RepID=A0A8S1T8B4_PAROT|nr:unnamed protein product [Paramecium octaurelia]